MPMPLATGEEGIEMAGILGLPLGIWKRDHGSVTPFLACEEGSGCLGL
jgi:hypothetical protein